MADREISFAGDQVDHIEHLRGILRASLVDFLLWSGADGTFITVQYSGRQADFIYRLVESKDQWMSGPKFGPTLSRRKGDQISNAGKGRGSEARC